MLRITQQSSGDAAKQYYASADYYREGAETIGRWGGEGARLLGLEGTVSRRAFNLLCDNRHPETGLALTARTKDERTVGYDFTFSVPKSVSLLYARTEDQQVLEAFRESVHETMAELEAEIKVRVRKKGRNQERLTGNIAYGEFIHFTSRPVDGVPDPQLHAHCFVFNATHDAEEGAWKAGQFRDLKRDAPYWQAAFRVRLANRLQQLGYGIERKRDDFELAGVPASAIRRFSRRTGRIEEVARERGIEDPDAKARLGALTREKKDKALSWDELTSEWNNRLTPAEREALDKVQTHKAGAVPEPAEARAVDFAIRHSFARESVVSEKRLLAEAMKHGLGAVTVEGVRKELASRKLLIKEQGGQRLVTTPEVLAEEERMIAFARDGRGTCKPFAASGTTPKDQRLNAGQRRAVEHILSSRDRVILVRGAAGTGKTTLMQEAVASIKEGGHNVVVLAPSAGASRGVLRGEGFDNADTIAKFLLSKEMQAQAAGQVIWVDEAGLLGSQDLAALFDVANRVKARVVLMGDRYQHSSPSRGAPLKLLERDAGVPSVEVAEIVRQRGDYKRAVGLLSEGYVTQGVDELDRLGWVREVADGERYRQMASAYLEASAEKKADGTVKTVLVVSPTHAEGDRITGAIRHELAVRGKLGEEREFTAWLPQHLTEAERGEASSYAAGDMLQFHQNATGHKSGERVVVAGQALPLDQAARYQVYRPTTLKIAAGDRVRITTNGKTADGRHRLVNGTIYTVEGFNRNGDIVVNNGWVIGKEFGHVAYGYAVTSHASQGKTVDKVLIGQSSLSLPAASREQFYVSVSRGREQAIIFTDDKEMLRAAVARDRERLTAKEVFRPVRRRGRERLARHWSFLRRLSGLAWDRQKPAFDRSPGQTLAQERMYERQ